jgi:hypothetical protein
MNILFIIILIILILIFININYSPFGDGSNTTSINICLITYKPNDKLLDFLDTFKNHKVYIIIDDNTTKYINDNKYKNLTFIQIDPKECQDSGFINSSISAMGPSKQIIAWDKALYYISTINTNYSHTWFIEDDVFLYNEEILNTIDSSYPTSDILTQKYIESDNNWYHFKNLNYSNDYSPPYYNTLICICRMSKKMMKLLKEFANKNKSLQYIESLYPTVAIKNNLKYDTPSEFNKIHWNNTEVTDDKNFIYHPVKDHEYQYQLRKK